MDEYVEKSNVLEKFTNIDPIKMPKSAGFPKNNVAARLIPAGGHTAVAYPGGIARRRDSLPTTK